MCVHTYSQYKVKSQTTTIKSKILTITYIITVGVGESNKIVLVVYYDLKNLKLFFGLFLYIRRAICVPTAVFVCKNNFISR